MGIPEGQLEFTTEGCSPGYYYCSEGCCDADRNCLCDNVCSPRGSNDFRKGCAYNPKGGSPAGPYLGFSTANILTTTINMVRLIVSTIVCWWLHVRLIQQGKNPTFGVLTC